MMLEADAQIMKTIDRSIAVDLDGTLAEYTGFIDETTIGAPILPMVERVKLWLRRGYGVKIFTARMHPKYAKDIRDVKVAIDRWCLEHIGQILPVTCMKDPGMVQIWDDRAVSVRGNTGVISMVRESDTLAAWEEK